MQSRTPIPPPRLPPPRVALQDITVEVNQDITVEVNWSPATRRSVGKKATSSMKAEEWLREQARARDEAEAYTKELQRAGLNPAQAAVKPWKHPSGPIIYPNPSRQTVPDSLQQAPVSAPSSARAAPASSSRKRKSEASSDDAIAAYKQSLDHIDTEGMIVDRDCNAVRALIRKVIDRGIFKKGEFCNTIGVSSNAVNRFLEQSGKDGGAYSDTYTEAWSWFKQREIARLSMPAASAESKKKAKTATARLSSANADLNSIHLDGEETDSVPVYDTCDVVRRKITAHLKTPGLTQAQFCRDLYAQLKTPSCKSIQATMLTAFRNKKGPLAGCTSSVYYAAYVYFEKLRLAEGKPKSKHRLEMEEIHAGGVDRERDPANQSYWVHESERVIEDQYGRLSFVRKF